MTELGMADLMSQFLTDHPAQRRLYLFAGHDLMQRLVDQRLVSALPSLSLEERNDRTIQHDGNALFAEPFMDRRREFFSANVF
jgi:hypothetical protein